MDHQCVAACRRADGGNADRRLPVFETDGLAQQGTSREENTHANAERHRSFVERRVRFEDEQAKTDFEQPRQQRQSPADKPHDNCRYQTKAAINQKSPAKQHRENQAGSMLPVDDQQPEYQESHTSRFAQSGSGAGSRCGHQQDDQGIE